ncbi:GAF domain-containing SpoIIE family protein phosphatase [Verrucomicrobium spinosum]|uniref:GAF domain-containing SpoIIE family protein phosphatase n=1 Tax=Verrucomicrobium spinosum TaxID=2736 RepID=UPI0001745A8D|nr:GAF domain-containing SpoIIE family protein phosphatase [Verrucomicrobium spinosum]
MSSGWIAAVIFFLAGAAGSYALFRSWQRERRLRMQFLQGDRERASRRRRVFEVLHILGDSILQGQPDTTLHRQIAEGAVKVVESEGAALYLLDDKGLSLVPRHYTKECPALIALPERIVTQAKTNAGTLPSYLRLHSVAPGEGVLGNVVLSQKAENVPDLRHHEKFDGETNPFQQHVAALMAPLRHGGRPLGVLAVASDRTQPFSQHQLEMFIALAEQVGFTLGNAQAHHEAGAKRQLEAELSNAREIQSILLPEKAPEMPGFSIAARNVPARMVSGDYFDYVPVSQTHLGVAIADVCGKGIPASLITAMCRSVLRSNARETFSPTAVLSAVNRNLFPDIREDMFITVGYLVLQKDGASVSFARAGHTNPLVWRKATGQVDEIKAPGLAVGVDKGEVFDRITRDVSIAMESGDILLLYTDGVDEATDHKGLLFGVERIKETLAEAAPDGPQAVVNLLCDTVNRFKGGEPQADDITIVTVARK